MISDIVSATAETTSPEYERTPSSFHFNKPYFILAHTTHPSSSYSRAMDRIPSSLPFPYTRHHRSEKIGRPSRYRRRRLAANAPHLKNKERASENPGYFLSFWEQTEMKRIADKTEHSTPKRAQAVIDGKKFNS